MPLLSYQGRFADLVESGEKLQTIRAFRKDGQDPKVGDRLYHWTGPYDHRRRRIGISICSNIQRITFHSDGELTAYGDFHEFYGPWPSCELKFARADGFESWNDLWAYFEKAEGLPFRGLLIRWDGLLPNG